MVKHTKRHGISLLEVLISIGIISLGIFGVATLIPVAQIKVAEGTSLDRQAALGPNAYSEFRIRNMDAPETWVGPAFPSAPEVTKVMPSRAVVIDPLGYWANPTNPTVPQAYFPASSTSRWRLPRYSLRSMPNLQVAQRTFYLQDDLEFDRPSDQAEQPRQRYFIDSTTRRPLAPAPGSTQTWFATLSPFAALTNFATDEFLLSIVICEGRVPEIALTEEYEIQARAGAFPGDLWVQNQHANQAIVNDLQIGDWILVAKVGYDRNAPNPTVAAVPGPTDFQAKLVYRWTKILGISDNPEQTRRDLVIANEDFLRPGEPARVFFVRGVESVFERTVRLENTSTAWD